MNAYKIAVKTLLTLLAVLLCSAALRAQSLDQGVSLPAREMTVREAIGEVQRQTRFVFVVSLSATDVQRRVVFPESVRTVKGVLDEVVRGTKHKYVTSGRQIILMKEEKSPVIAVARATSRSGEPINDSFEADVTSYTGRHEPTWTPQPGEPVLRYDTVMAELPHDGRFRYAGREFQPRRTGPASAPARSAGRIPLLALKVNLLYGAVALAPNLSLEVGLGRRTSLELMGGWNGWHRKGTAGSNQKLAHIVAKPEFRYWFCERFNGHYLGVHAFFWRYNIGGHDIPLLFEREYRYDGRAVGAGVSYGYHWAWNRRWGMEFNVGVGYALMKYDKYDCQRCQATQGTYRKHYFGPTSAGVKLVFMIR